MLKAAWACRFRSRLRDAGAVALEYALMVALVAVVASVGVRALGLSALDLFAPAIALF